MNYIKQHKFTVFVIFLFIAAVIVLFFMFNLFFSNGRKPEYGNRLEGIEDVNLSKEDLSKLKSTLKESKNVTSIETNITGRTLNIIITVGDDVSIDSAKGIGKKCIDSLNEKQIKFYSVQIFLNKKDASLNNFPIIGYKQRGKKDLTWTKNRGVTKPNEE